MNNQKIGIIGCGFVGATIAYTLVSSGMFSEIVLIDIDEKRAAGEAMDLAHCLPFISPMQIYAGDYKDLADASIVVITAGANQKEGETRLDLACKNAKITADIVERISAVNRDCILLMVANPVDILTKVALCTSHFPPSRVIGSGTVLDTARLKFLVGERLGVDSRNVHTFIIGEHGDSELAVWSSANVSGLDMKDYCGVSDGKCRTYGDITGMFDYVKNSAYEIIRGKGATYYAIAQAVARIISSIMKNQHTIMPVSTLVDGHYGLEGLCISVPAIVGRSGVESVLDIPLNDDEMKRLHMSAAALEEVWNSLGISDSALELTI